MINKERILIFGGTGSLGRTLVKRFSENNVVAVFSRDEAKHFFMKQEFPNIIYIIGDIRNKQTVESVIFSFSPTIIINAAAMKQVPICEDFPYEAVLTNVLGTQNIVEASNAYLNEHKFLSISTDKAAKPINSYGFTKALEERLHLRGKNNYNVCVRYGNVLESTGSVIPFFKKRILNKQSIPITDIEMTRFLLSLDQAVDLIVYALNNGKDKYTYIPKVKSCKILDLAEVLCDYYNYNKSNIEITNIRPGEKIHEILISEEECRRVIQAEDKYAIQDVLLPLIVNPFLKKEYSSKDETMSRDELNVFLVDRGVI